MVVRVVPIRLLIAPSVISGWLRDDPGDAVRLVRPLADGGVARPLGAADLVGALGHLHAIVGIGLSLVDLVLGQLMRPHRIAAGQLACGGVIGDRLHFQDVEAAELGDLLEAERSIVDQPRGGRMGHERLGHGETSCLKQIGPPLAGAAAVSATI